MPSNSSTEKRLFFFVSMSPEMISFGNLLSDVAGFTVLVIEVYSLRGI